jgi:hypothetical protein
MKYDSFPRLNPANIFVRNAETGMDSWAWYSKNMFSQLGLWLSMKSVTGCV